MSFERENFNLIGPGAGHGSKHWSYITLNATDAIAVIDNADFFLEVNNEVRAGDMIYVVCVATGTVLNPTTITSLTHLVVITAVGPQDTGTETVTTFANALAIV